MLTDALPLYAPRFRTTDEVRESLRAACGAHPKIAQYHEIGASERGIPMDAVRLGTGPLRVSLLAGAHADEPVGPETLRHLVVEVLEDPESFAPMLERFTFCIVPHVNPDGEANNRPWIERWPDPLAYLRHTVREPPGRDVEFGYPEMRVENTHVSAFMRERGPFALHMSLHGMGAAEGAMLLIERRWIERTAELRRAYRESLEAAGLGLHDHDRK
ncbi:MAG: M14 family zinc carboxypeptidase, partial [Planctomycetota bacterium]